jgi:FHS family L-fucose permease-like MFS transporter
MFPTIFTLAIKNLGTHTKQGSSYLIMAIVGGAIIPLFVGMVSDKFSIHQAFVVPLICYLPILYFAMQGYKVKNELA